MRTCEMTDCPEQATISLSIQYTPGTHPVLFGEYCVADAIVMSQRLHERQPGSNVFVNSIRERV